VVETSWSADPALIAPIAARYGLEVGPSSIPALCAEYAV
jgi:hypothetical protein